MALATTGLLVASALVAPASNAQAVPQAAPAPALTNTIPGVDEIVSSPNLRQIANVPKVAPLDATNSDIAFQGKYAFAGNYNGFVIYDISRPERAKGRVPGALPGVAERHLRPR